MPHKARRGRVAHHGSAARDHGGGDGLFRHRRHRVHRPVPVAQSAKARRAGLRAGAQGLAEKARRAARGAGAPATSNVIPVVGDLREGTSAWPTPTIKKLRGKIDASVPSRRGLRPQRRPPRSSSVANVEGTRHAVEFAQAIAAGCFHHVSSIAAAGLYDGVFREDMFDEAEELDHPYFKTKHDSEGIVRQRMQAAVPHLPSGIRRRRLEDGLHRQDRRALLLLQGDPEDARLPAAMDADDRHRGRAHQHRAGRLRRRRARISSRTRRASTASASI